MQRLVIVGGGVSGLSAAWAARKALDGAGEVLVLERAAQPGGRSARSAATGFVVEAGPTSYLDDSLPLDRLIRDIGLEPGMLPASRASARRFLVLDGKLRELGPTPGKFFSSGILSAGGILRLFAEPFVPRGGTSARRCGSSARDASGRRRRIA